MCHGVFMQYVPGAVVQAFMLEGLKYLFDGWQHILYSQSLLRGSVTEK